MAGQNVELLAGERTRKTSAPVQPVRMVRCGRYGSYILFQPPRADERAKSESIGKVHSATVGSGVSCAFLARVIVFVENVELVCESGNSMGN
jgi:hypothetical protein